MNNVYDDTLRTCGYCKHRAYSHTAYNGKRMKCNYWDADTGPCVCDRFVVTVTPVDGVL